MISAFSLKALVDISRHETLAPRLTHLVIGLDDFGMLPSFPRLAAEEHAEQEHLADSQRYLLDTGGAVELLTQALVNLPNLKTVDLRTFNSRTRYRDNGYWASYGYSESPEWPRLLLRNGGVLAGPNNPVPDGSESFVRRAFKALLVSLGRSNSLVQSLEFLSRQATKLTDKAFSLFPNLDYLNHKLPDVLLRLTKLHLDLELDFIGVSEGMMSEAIRTPNTAAEAFDHASVKVPRNAIHGNLEV